MARNTPCGVREEGGRLSMVGTTRGDGTVTWESGRIGGIGQFFYMPAEHGDLPATKEHFPALVELLTTGSDRPAARGRRRPRARSSAAAAELRRRPADRSTTPTRWAGRCWAVRRAARMPLRRKRRLEVRVQAEDLRFLTQPILVGHYEQRSDRRRRSA